MRTTRAAKTYLIVSLLLVVCTFAVWYVSVRLVIRQGTILTEQTTQAANQTVRNQTYQTLKQTVAGSATERASLMSHILTEDKTITFLTNIESDATAHGVTLVTNSIKRQAGKGILDSLTVSLALTGPTSKVRQMISMLETLPYYGSVDSLVYMAGDATKSQATKANIQLTLGLLKQPPK